jgi:hypothetical protein
MILDIRYVEVPRSALSQLIDGELVLRNCTETTSRVYQTARCKIRSGRLVEISLRPKSDVKTRAKAQLVGSEVILRIPALSTYARKDCRSFARK